MSARIAVPSAIDSEDRGAGDREEAPDSEREDLTPLVGLPQPSVAWGEGGGERGQVLYQPGMIRPVGIRTNHSLDTNRDLQTVTYEWTIYHKYYNKYFGILH